MTVRDHLRALAEALPPDGAAMVPVAWIRELLEERGASALVPPDLTVRDLARQFQRGVSTVRGWLEEGLFAGAYRLHGKDWRVPPAAVQAFQERQRAPNSDARRHGQTVPVDLGAWRRHRAD